jgi:LPXTG-motif cell wall-anchored protein
MEEQAGEQTTIAFPLWGIGAVLAAWGLLRGKPLLFLIGAAAFFADHEAEHVRRARELLSGRVST